MFLTSVMSIVPNTLYRPVQRLIKPLAKSADIVEIAGDKFTPLERKLMSEVREYSKEHGVETAKLLDRKAQLVNIALEEAPGSVGVIAQPGERISNKMFKCTFIHSHTCELPVSGTDIIMLCKGKCKKIVATTPGGGYSSIGFPMFSNPERPMKAAGELQRRQRQKAENLGLLTIGEDAKLIFDSSKVSIETFNVYRLFCINTIQDFANKFRLKFEHNLG